MTATTLHLEIAESTKQTLLAGYQTCRQRLQPLNAREVRNCSVAATMARGENQPPLHSQVYAVCSSWALHTCRQLRFATKPVQLPAPIESTESGELRLREPAEGRLESEMPCWSTTF